jgi:hypothetical protein
MPVRLKGGSATGKRMCDELLPVGETFDQRAAHDRVFRPRRRWMGEKELELRTCGKGDGLFRFWIATYGQLKLLPQWDPLRGDARFEKIVASLAPK